MGDVKTGWGERGVDEGRGGRGLCGSFSLTMIEFFFFSGVSDVKVGFVAVGDARSECKLGSRVDSSGWERGGEVSGNETSGSLDCISVMAGVVEFLRVCAGGSGDAGAGE